jgi:prepilin-type N-terminal cleavage/methylation domain-containing protein
MRSETVKNKGFTVLELVVGLALFSLVLSMCYAALLDASKVYQRVSESAVQQQQQRTTYRTLRDALRSGAQVSGDRESLSLDLSSATSLWALTSSNVRFQIVDGKELWEFHNTNVDGQRLLQKFHGLRFSFGNSEGEMQSHWHRQEPPSRVGLSWSSDPGANGEGFMDARSSLPESPKSPGDTKTWLFFTP